MKGSKKTQRVILGVAFIIVLSGLILTALDMYKVGESIKLFGRFNLGIVLIFVGGVLVLFAPKPAGKKKKRSFY